MKLIFSRKGFDTNYGGIPSPILPDGSMISFPIPHDQEPTFKDIKYNKTNLFNILDELAYGFEQDQGTHLDPDLRYEARPRSHGWLPCFGQVGNPQSHLENMGVSLGDLFLFFGWFHQTYYDDIEEKILFAQDAPDLHMLFGWLQIGDIFKPTLDPDSVPDWASHHPHVHYAEDYPESNNTLYVAFKHLHIPGLKKKIAGGGVFNKFNRALQLTAPGCTRSIWQLPQWMFPSNGRKPLSYHKDIKRWRREDNHTLLQTVGKGQEFVLDCDEYPEAASWLLNLFKQTT